jgi:hypothetical protein
MYNLYIIIHMNWRFCNPQIIDFTYFVLNFSPHMYKISGF